MLEISEKARGLQIKENMRSIGAQVLEQVVRGAYGGTNGTEYPGDVIFNESSMQTTTNLLQDPTLLAGGKWTPTDCIPRWKVAILVPFRNRHEHLPILLRHLIPMLQRQRLQFGIYVIEQTGEQAFNRAMLFNVGYSEALMDQHWDCMVFHDFFGGVSGLTVRQFRKINGFPNGFWGWGGEDDDLWNRVKFAGYNVSRPPGDLGRYMSIPHHHRGEAQFLGRYALLRRSKVRQAVDGLSNLHYRPVLSRRALYTNITASLSPDLAPMGPQY
ncbi:hypothetical protein JZ751_019975 [Albula glossodonta]|uniref:Galactosyltransferase N-terminal domain-containing protein n=1 Tax=Albula glossodonta TaxID=121402 RepID=A0A8T2N3L7_9TELE|nr:hypothetical protein JZ751_019975 [Albula glossodonta]